MLLKILTLTGGRTVYQIKIQNTIRNKISVSNIIISIFVCGFTFYSDHVTEEVARSKGDAFRETNNIIRGIVAIIRVRSLFQQPVLALTTYIQSKHTLEFMIKLQEMDEFLLDGGVRLEGILWRIRLCRNNCVPVNNPEHIYHPYFLLLLQSILQIPAHHFWPQHEFVAPYQLPGSCTGCLCLSVRSGTEDEIVQYSIERTLFKISTNWTFFFGYVCVKYTKGSRYNCFFLIFQTSITTFNR